MKDRFDVVVVGAGPGGLAAAATAVDAGKEVCLVDDNATCGGQIWRGMSDGSSGPGAKWLSRITGRVTLRLGWRAIGTTAISCSSSRAIRIEREGRSEDIRYSALILATGSRELFLPFPGWTLPGVYGAGGLMAFVKSGLDIAGKRVVVAGTGPLLLAVAAGLRKSRARVAAIVDQAQVSRLIPFSLSLLWGHAGKLAEGARYLWNVRGIPYHTAAWISCATGREHLQSVTLTSGSRAFEIEADMLAVGFHLVPNAELARLLDCEVRGGFVIVNSVQETSVRGIYCVGEATGIGGADKAQIEGQIAGFAAAGQAGMAMTRVRALKRQMSFVRRLEATFTLRDELRALPADDTYVCRCEDVSHERLRTCHSWHEAKLHTRCGMGPCQGRICGSATQYLYGWEAPNPRPPIFPADVATLAVPDKNSP